MAPDDNPFDTGSGTTTTATAPTPATPTPADATKDKPVTASTDARPDSRPDGKNGNRQVIGAALNDKTSVPAQGVPDAPKQAASAVSVAPLLVVIRDGKIAYADPAVVLIDADEVLADGNGADEIVAALKNVATTRDDAGRAALTDEFMGEVRTRLGL